MSNPIFSPETFAAGVELVVGDCNGVPATDRWAKETPLFCERICSHFTPETKTVLDYGCGIGRLSKAVLAANPELEVIGVDDSSKHLSMALAYVNDERFEALSPGQLNRTADLIYCIYVLQHVPAIELREALQRMHTALVPGGTFICCTAEYRMAIRFDRVQFFDDRFLGVNIRREIERFFEPVEPLFDAETVGREEVLQRILLGLHAGERKDFVTHHAWVYKRREIEGPLFNAPFRS